MLGAPEIILIVLAILVLFGGKKVIEFSRSLGKASVEFKKGREEAEREWDELKKPLSDKKSSKKK